MCDNEQDCGFATDASGPDTSDEDPSMCRGDVSCLRNEFSCKNNATCLAISRFCDGSVDCPDNSDEGHFCKLASSCRKAGCEHGCAITWRGPKCFCPKGREPDGTACVDQDECLVAGVCDQQCTNLDNSYSCACATGYEASDGGRTCAALNVPPDEPASLLFANSVNLQRVGLDGENLGVVGTHETLSLDFDHRNRSLCWIAHYASKEAQKGRRKTFSAMICSGVDDLSQSWEMPPLDMFSFDSVNQVI